MLKKKSGFLDSLKNKNKKDSNIANNWDYMKDTNEEYINIHLRWCKKNYKNSKWCTPKTCKSSFNGIKGFFKFY